VVTPVTDQLQQGVEAVTSVVTQAVTQVVTPTINWSTYPWNSGDEKTLKNRAGKVKERILNCQTHNDLIKLLAKDKVSEREIDWLKENLLTRVEVEQLETMKNTRQGNLFAQVEEDSTANCSELVIEFDWNTVMDEISMCMKKLDWSIEDGKNYLQSKYGVSSRLYLSDEEIVEFLRYLQDQLE
jgi:hypothetical protein